MDQYSKTAVVSSFDEVVFLNKLNFKNFTYNACNEAIMTIPTVFYLRKHSYLTEIVNEKIDDLKSAGLIDYFISKYLDPKYLKVERAAEGPRKLNLRELLVAFQLLVYGLISGLVGFVIEISANFYRRRMKSSPTFVYLP